MGSGAQVQRFDLVKRIDIASIIAELQEKEGKKVNACMYLVARITLLRWFFQDQPYTT